MKDNDISMDFINSLTRKLEALNPMETPIEKKSLKAGDIAPDGSIYLGCYKDQDWFVTATDAKGKDNKNMTMNFNAAAKYTKKLEAHGHTDWIMPPGKDDPKNPDILNEMCENKSTGAFVATYEEYTRPDRWYWSSTTDSSDADKGWQKSFYGTSDYSDYKHRAASVRPVRSVPRPL